MRSYLFLLICALPLFNIVNAQLWLPFSKLAMVLQQLKAFDEGLVQRTATSVRSTTQSPRTTRKATTPSWKPEKSFPYSLMKMNKGNGRIPEVPVAPPAQLSIQYRPQIEASRPAEPVKPPPIFNRRPAEVQKVHHPKIEPPPLPPPSMQIIAPPTNPLPNCEPGQHCRLKLRSFESEIPLFKYAYSHSTPIEPVLRAVFEQSQNAILPPPLKWNQTIAPEVVQLGVNLMQFVRPNRALVVGVFTGLTAVATASAINERGLVIGVENPANLQYWELVGNKYAQQAGLMRRIQIRADFPIPETLDQLSRAEPGSFDFVLLDDPLQENYLIDYEKCLTLLRSGGLMLINDEITDQLNQKIRDDSRVSATFLPYSSGVFLVIKK